LSKPFSIRYTRLKEEEFLNLEIEPMDSFNWKWRKPHLDAITNDRRFTRVGDIIEYFKSLNSVWDIDITETETALPFYEPHNYDPLFWQSGNNFFIYNVIFGFRRGVIPYSGANQYIREGNKPSLYSKQYYEGLEIMTDKEISEFLNANYIEIENNAVASGKHRVCAMIGRIVKDEGYIPMRAIVLK
jgi:hypothetical protein